MQKQADKFVIDSFHSDCPQRVRSQQRVPTDPKYIADYNQFFGCICLSQISQYQDKLSQAGIQYHSDKFFSEPNFTWLYESSTFKIIIVQVGLSYFSIKLEIINLQRPSLGLKKLKKLAHGSFGEIYLMQDQHHKMHALKCIRYQESALIHEVQKMNNSIRNSLVELCFYKLFSCLQIGPLYTRPFGFDCITYSNGLQYAIEYCEPVVMDTIICDLNSRMKLMHSLKIIHGDMKLENILYSPSRKCNVLIDFNCSKVIDEELGYKTLTNFHGTFWYSSAEMKEIAMNGQSKHIDEYYNDLNGLLQANKDRERRLQISKKLKKSEQLLSFSPISNVFYIMIKLQYVIFKREQTSVISLLSSLKSIRDINLAQNSEAHRKRRTSIQVAKRRLEDKGNLKVEFKNQNLKIANQLNNYSQILQTGESSEIDLWQVQEQVQFKELINEAMQIFLEFSATKSLTLIKQMIFQELKICPSQNKYHNYETVQHVQKHIQNKKIVLPAFKPQLTKFRNRFWLIGGQRFFQVKGEPYLAVYKRKKTKLQEKCFSFIFKLEEQFILENYGFLENNEPLPEILACLEKEAVLVKPSEKLPDRNSENQGRFLSYFKKAITSAECNNEILEKLLLIFQKKYQNFYIKMIHSLNVSWQMRELDANRKIRLIIKYLQEDSGLSSEERALKELAKFQNLKKRRTQYIITKLKASIHNKKLSERNLSYQILCQKLHFLEEASQSTYYQTLLKVTQQLESIENHDEKSLSEIKMYLRYLEVQPFIRSRHSPHHVLSKKCEDIINWLHSNNMEQSSIYENIKLLHCFMSLLEFKVVKTSRTFKEILQTNFKFNRQAFVLIQILGQFLKLNFVEPHESSKNYLQFWKSDSTQDFVNGLNSIWRVTINDRQRIMFISALRSFSFPVEVSQKVQLQKYQALQFNLCKELKLNEETIYTYFKQFMPWINDQQKCISYEHKIRLLNQKIQRVNLYQKGISQLLTMIKQEILSVTDEAINQINFTEKTGLQYLSYLQSLMREILFKVNQQELGCSLILLLSAIYCSFSVLNKLNSRAVDSKDVQGKLFSGQINNNLILFENFLKTSSSYFHKSFFSTQNLDQAFFTLPIYSLMIVQLIRAKQYQLVKEYFLSISKQVHNMKKNYGEGQSWIINYYLWTIRIFMEAAFFGLNQEVIFELCVFVSDVQLKDIFKTMYSYLIVLFVVLEIVCHFFTQRVINFAKKTQIIYKIVRLLSFNSSFMRNRVKIDWYPLIITMNSIKKVNVLLKAIRSPQYRTVTDPFYQYLFSKIKAKDLNKKKVMILAALLGNSQKKRKPLEKNLELMKESILKKFRMQREQKKKQFNLEQRLDISIPMHRIYWSLINSSNLYKDRTVIKGFVEYSYSSSYVRY